MCLIPESTAFLDRGGDHALRPGARDSDAGNDLDRNIGWDLIRNNSEDLPLGGFRLDTIEAIFGDLSRVGLKARP
jgi:hypothetical protein